MDLSPQILELLAKGNGLKASQIAKELGVERQRINAVLYGPLKGQVRQDKSYRWHLAIESRKETQVAEPSSSCRSIKGEKRWSPAAIGRHYDANHFHSFNEHIAFYKRCDFETCLKLAPLGQTDTSNHWGILKRHSHQACLKELGSGLNNQY